MQQRLIALLPNESMPIKIVRLQIKKTPTEIEKRTFNLNK